MNIPCENCITLAICIAQAVRFENGKPIGLATHILIEKCSLYREYYQLEGYFNLQNRYLDRGIRFDIFMEANKK